MKGAVLNNQKSDKNLRKQVNVDNESAVKTGAGITGLFFPQAVAHYFRYAD